MEKVRWGVLSTAKIGVDKVIPGILKSEYCELVAISSRDRAKAEISRESLGLAKAYGSYEELLADPDIDAVYNPLPNHLHVDWSIKALEAGKHVLCEKPLGMDAKDASRLLDASARFPQLKAMEAFMYRFHPQWIAAKNWVDEGKIGTLKTIHSIFTYYNIDPNNIRNRADIGGGGLLDIGCYCISLARFIFGKQPGRVLGTLERDAVTLTDIMCSGVLDFEDGTSTFTCGTQLSNYQRVQIMGTKGRIEIEIPFNPLPAAETRIWLHTSDGSKELVMPACDHYTAQADAFALAILNDEAAPTPLRDAIENMEVIDAVFSSAESSGWVAVKP